MKPQKITRSLHDQQSKTPELTITQCAPVGLVLTEHRIIRTYNQTFADMFGYGSTELAGQSFQRFYGSIAEFESIRDIGIEPLKCASNYSDERIVRKSDGTTVWCRFRAHTLTPQNPLSRIVMSFTHIPVTPHKTSLTPREREVITYLGLGMTSKEISRILTLSPRTIEDIRSRLLRKFDVANTAQLLGMFGNLEL